MYATAHSGRTIISQLVRDYASALYVGLSSKKNIAPGQHWDPPTVNSLWWAYNFRLIH